MKITDLFPWNKQLNAENAQLKQDIQIQQEEIQEIKAYVSSFPVVPDGSIILPQYRYTPFDGEKNDGALGPILNYAPRYHDLAQRAWSIYITSDIAKTVIDKWVTWIIDQGLSLKANPVKLVLESEGIEMNATDSERFNDTVEARFGVWSKSMHSSSCGMKNLRTIAKEAFMNAKLGGDVLVILRYVDGAVKVQLLDGRRIMNPGLKEGVDEGNIVSNGIEIEPSGKHAAYWTRGKGGKADRIPAYSNTGLQTAFLVRGSKWTLDYHRGMPVLATVMESIGKLDRYKEAVVANAEEISKIVMQVVHGSQSDGSDPLNARGILNRFQSSNSPQTVPVDDLGEQIARKISATFQKQTINMPKDSELKAVQPSATIREFRDFYETNSHIICAAVGIPPNVAFSLYTDSFSASRAATKDWDHTIDVERDDFTTQFYMPIYKFWLFTQIMEGKVNAPGFVEAFIRGNYMVVDSYTNARFTGPHFPHIDPLKEVNAERAKLGDLGANIPLTTVEQATEALGGGDSDSNMEQFADELNIARGLGIKVDEPDPVQQTNEPPLNN